MKPFSNGAVAVAAIALAGCKSSPPSSPPPSPALTSAAHAASSPISTATLAAAAPASVEQVVCHDRSPCRVDRETAAGRDHDGRPLTVVKVALTELDPKAREKAGSLVGEEYWLLVGDPVAAGRAQVLVEYSENYRDLDDSHTGNVSENRFEFVHGKRSSSGARKQSQSVELSLAPLRITRTAYQRQDAPGWNEGGWLDLTTLQGEGYWGGPSCAPGGDLIGAAFTLIPSTTLPPEFLATAWKSARLDGCSAHIDGREPRFTSLAGDSELPKTNAELSLVASGRTLIVEVIDQKLVDPGDQIEIWLSTGTATCANWSTSCVDQGTDAAPRQWLIAAANGRVSAGFGRPAATDLAVEIADGPQPQHGVAKRFKVRLPDGFDRITVVYDNVNAPGGAPQMLPTSRFAPKVSASFGRFEIIDPSDATCVLGANGSLTAMSTHSPEPGRAFITMR